MSKSQGKKLKELLTWNEKYFLSFLKGFQLSEIASDPRTQEWNFNLKRKIYIQKQWRIE